mmetsp:Transcript_27245/g.64712  ORF Transcript_27245/g.64712 Transcript_27245/m.64712 type:complete len:92 (+) Transcript_27245:183-458(+)
MSYDIPRGPAGLLPHCEHAQMKRPCQDLARNVGREVAKIDSINMAPQVYGYVSKAQPVRGAFGATGATMQRARLERVDIPFRPNQGLFSEA